MGKGTEGAFFLELVSDAVNWSQFTAGIWTFCDLSKPKAFDFVDFPILTAKLRCSVVGVVALSWLKFYITSRQGRSSSIALVTEKFRQSRFYLWSSPFLNLHKRSTESYQSAKLTVCYMLMIHRSL